MRAQRNMKLLLQRQKYLVKNMGALMPVPIAAIYVLALPLCIVQSRNGNAEELRSFVSQFSQGVFSVLSVWWVIFGVREYFEADGCEVLFLHNRRGFLPDAILFYLLFAVSAAPFYIIMNAVAGISLFALLRLLLSGIFCFGLVYFLMFLTHSTAITLMTLFIYSLGGMLIYRSHPIFPFCYDLNNATAENCLEFYLPLALIGVLLIVAGQIVISKTQDIISKILRNFIKTPDATQRRGSFYLNRFSYNSAIFRRCVCLRRHFGLTVAYIKFRVFRL